MDFAAADAHIHLADLLDRDPDFPERINPSRATPWPRATSWSLATPWSRWTCCAASHDEAEWYRIEALRPRLPVFVSSFGIHPQWAVWKNADFLARLAAERRIAAIGEAGFDFYGDRPERVRTAETRARSARSSNTNSSWPSVSASLSFSICARRWTWPSFTLGD